MGLTHPRDLDAWRRWEQHQRPLAARVTGAIRARRGVETTAVLTSAGDQPRVLVALEALKDTTRLSQLSPVGHLDPGDVAVLSPTPVLDDLTPMAPAVEWAGRPGLADALAAAAVRQNSIVLSTGHYAALGAASRQQLREPSRFLTVQHGLLTPSAPPLAEGTTLLAWSDADADFWRSGRDDVTTVTVGSQLLWEAARAPRVEVADERPVFLGQLHGAELPRAAMAASAKRFCLRTGATYRPHPSETDRASRRQHAQWEAEGIEVDRSTTPLVELRRPVVSAYSTGVLEMAARGIPAWVHFDDPPAWLREFWDRYSLAPWGGEPTPAPRQPDLEPARAVADHITQLLGESS
ncbi:hypothetical protein BCF74_10247 [Knoellia remsis]|uniref:RNA-binding protein n=1 Tax=Knoellia remsis TaxID=407159 RepID=A0A2T0UZ75_9MICO|nr:RNA-binding protein [Knoellia remsis]PRY63216.1 hypothetical protein BCF74_10247 [Knoellia remsis]